MKVPSNKEIMENLFKLYERKMFITANSILNNHGQAEDAVQDAFIRAMPYLGIIPGLCYSPDRKHNGCGNG